jgi:uncharacterized protein
MSHFERITLANGKTMCLDKPSWEVMDIDTIAHSLSNICRFIGHTNKFYSVAQHSVLVSNLVPSNFAFEGLMHDAAEAFCGDMSSPIKNKMPGFRQLEQSIRSEICTRYKLPLTDSIEVQRADKIAVVTEASQLTKSKHYMGWFDGITPVDLCIIPLTPEEAKKQFLDRFEELVMGINNQDPDFTEELELCCQLDRLDEEFWEENKYDWA